MSQDSQSEKLYVKHVLHPIPILSPSFLYLPYMPPLKFVEFYYTCIWYEDGALPVLLVAADGRVISNGLRGLPRGPVQRFLVPMQIAGMSRLRPGAEGYTHLDQCCLDTTLGGGVIHGEGLQV